jgi:hypothetical protein
MEQDGPHWTDFHEILYLTICRKSVEKTEASLQCDNNNGTSHADRRYTLTIISCPILLRIRNVQTKVLGKSKHKFYVRYLFFRELCRSLGNVQNIVQPERPQVTIWRIHSARCYLRLQMQTQNM